MEVSGGAVMGNHDANALLLLQHICIDLICHPLLYSSEHEWAAGAKKELVARPEELLQQRSILL